MKKLPLLFALLFAAPLFAQQQQTLPDCQIGPVQNITATGRQVVFDNRTLGCTNWTLYEFGNGSVSTISIELDEAPDAGGAPGAWVVWPSASVGSQSTHPIVTATVNQASVFKFFPWISVNLTTLTGAGASLTFEALGYRPRFNADAASVPNAPVIVSAGGGTGSPVLSTQNSNIPATVETNAVNPSIFAAQNTANSPLAVENFGVDPCQASGVPKKSVPINITTATTTSLVATSGSTQIFPCAMSFTLNSIITTAQTVQFEFGTGAACVTTQSVQTGLFGSGNIIAAADINITVPEIGPSAAAAAFCAVTVGASVNVQGILTFVQQ